MRREILTLGAPILREKATPVRKFDANLRRLVEDMIETMKSANGLGLAAPQIGVSQRVIVVLQDEDSPLALANPEIIYSEGLDEGEEGCLSIPNLFGIVPRPQFVEVTGFNPKGKQVKVEAEGLLARAICHEIDHLDGILFIDKAYPNTLRWAEQEETKETPAK